MLIPLPLKLIEVNNDYYYFENKIHKIFFSKKDILNGFNPMWNKGVWAKMNNRREIISSDHANWYIKEIRKDYPELLL